MSLWGIKSLHLVDSPGESFRMRTHFRCLAKLTPQNRDDPVPRWQSSVAQGASGASWVVAQPVWPWSRHAIPLRSDPKQYEDFPHVYHPATPSLGLHLD